MTIEEMKQNTTVFGLLPLDVQEQMKKIGFSNFNEFSSPDWETANRFFGSFAYRLRPDYQPPKPELKVVKCEVRVYNCQLTFNHYGFCYCLTKAIELPNFSHFEYADGTQTEKARICTMTNRPAECPKYVVFIEQGE